MENGVWVPQKVEHRITIWPINSTSRYAVRTSESRDWNRCLYIHVYSSIIKNSQNVEATQLSINVWMDKQNVVYPYNEISFSLKKERNCDTCCNTDEHYTKWNKPDRKGQILFDSIYIGIPGIVGSIETESRRVGARAGDFWGMRTECLMVRAGEDEKVLEIAVTVIQQCERWTIGLKVIKMVYFMLHIFCHNKRKVKRGKKDIERKKQISEEYIPYNSIYEKFKTNQN